MYFGSSEEKRLEKEIRAKMSKNTYTDMEIEVVMKKKMRHSEYLKMVSAAEQKGWSVKAYQIGFHSDGTKKRIT